MSSLKYLAILFWKKKTYVYLRDGVQIQWTNYREGCFGYMSEPFWFFDRRFDSVPHVTVFALERRRDVFWKLELEGVAVCPS